MVVRTGSPLAALVLALCVAGVAMPAAAATKKHAAVAVSKKALAKKPAAKPKPIEPPQMVLQLADWVVRTGDNGDLPFAIVDKTQAVVAVFDAEGKLLGADAALVGSAQGDDSAPGVGDRELADIPLEDRTTPAGRFIGGFGRAAGQQRVLWVDYGTAISMHAVITTHPKERRPQRLRSKTPDDNRITHGCINVPAKFYTGVVRPAFRKERGLFYILPDTKPLGEVFPDFDFQMRVAGPSTTQVNSEPPQPTAPSEQL